MTYLDKIVKDVRNCDDDHISTYDIIQSRLELMDFIGCDNAELDKILVLMAQKMDNVQFASDGVYVANEEPKPLDLVVNIYHSLCATSTFKVNNIHADASDFGYMHDEDPENAEDYGCGNMQFVPKPASVSVLAKYNISLDDYNTICARLKDGLSFGSCGWCV